MSGWAFVYYMPRMWATEIRERMLRWLSSGARIQNFFIQVIRFHLSLPCDLPFCKGHSQPQLSIPCVPINLIFYLLWEWLPRPIATPASWLCPLGLDLKVSSTFFSKWLPEQEKKLLVYVLIPNNGNPNGTQMVT